MTRPPPDALPDRIRTLLANKGYSPSDCLFALRSTFRPNFALPTLWLILTQDALMLCNTHRTRGLYREFRSGDINYLHLAGHSLEIALADIHAPHIYVPFPPTSVEKLGELIGAATRLLCRA